MLDDETSALERRAQFSFSRRIGETTNEKFPCAVRTHVMIPDDDLSLVFDASIWAPADTQTPSPEVLKEDIESAFRLQAGNFENPEVPGRDRPLCTNERHFAPSEGCPPSD